MKGTTVENSMVGAKATIYILKPRGTTYTPCLTGSDRFGGKAYARRLVSL
jgi:hypothetical protein